MARITKEHDERRGEILDTAQQLFYQKGYQQTSIQDIIDTIGIAKGTFYHYFGSKLDLLDELVERLLAQSVAVVEPIVKDPMLDAVTKLQRFFEQANSFKDANKAFLLMIVQPFYSDENTIFRQKLTDASVGAMTPLLTAVLEQGIAEGHFTTPYPAELAEMILLLGRGLTDPIMGLFLRPEENSRLLPLIAHKVHAYHHAIAQLLGVAPGTVQIINWPQLQQLLEA
ncbi:MAG: TetR/AcrR family transcriptional regulator [Chloroflexota bacterium]